MDEKQPYVSKWLLLQNNKYSHAAPAPTLLNALLGSFLNFSPYVMDVQRFSDPPEGRQTRDIDWI